LRYLYPTGEDHELLPSPDEFTTFNISEETTKSKEATAGLSGGMQGPSASVELHVTSSKTVTVARDYHSWRRGVSMEKCKSLLSLVDLAACVNLSR